MLQGDWVPGIERIFSFLYQLVAVAMMCLSYSRCLVWPLLVHEQRNQNDDRDRDAKKEQN
jgi:hypothetical protein